VLLAADLGASSAHAADEAIELAARQHAVLLILTVVPPTAVPRLRRRGGASVERERRDRAAREIVARAAARGVTATSVVWYGEPAEAILEAARTQRADIVVLGSRKRTNLGRLLGSVSAHVVGEATCPVVVVPS
jgi:nucleotide-binding universal stress UspA family protein